MSNCNCCFPDWVCGCLGAYDNITLNTSLTPATAYRWRITDKFENVYEEEVFTDDAGRIDIPVAQLPAGFLNPYGGEFKLEILAENSCEPIKFLLAKEVDCVTVSVKGGTLQKSNIGCQWPAV